MYNVEEMITRALKNKLLIPKALYNIQINFTGLDSSVDKLFKNNVNDIATMSDIIICRTMLLKAAHRAICKNLLCFGLPIISTGNFKDTFTSTVLLSLETSANSGSYTTLLDFDNSEVAMVIQNEIINLIDKIILDLKHIDPNILDISDFFTYSSHEYISINDYVMYKSIQDTVISILRF